MSELEDLAGGTGQEAREARRTLKRRSQASARGSSAGDDFSPLLDAFDSLVERLAPSERRKLGGDIATSLRAANAGRIRPNVEPDGDSMEPRKRRKSGRLRAKRIRDEASASRKAKRSIRQEKMFRGAANPRYLRKESSQGEAQVGFVGAMARIMRVHQYGETDTVTRDPSSPRVAYPARVVLGINADDRSRILDQISSRITP